MRTHRPPDRLPRVQRRRVEEEHEERRLSKGVELPRGELPILQHLDHPHVEAERGNVHRAGVGAVGVDVGAAQDDRGGGFEGRDEMIAARPNAGRSAVHQQGSIAIDATDLEDRSEKEQAIRNSLARMTDDQVDQMIVALNGIV